MTQESIAKLIQMIKDCTELDSVDISELIRESNLQVQEKL